MWWAEQRGLQHPHPTKDATIGRNNRASAGRRQGGRRGGEGRGGGGEQRGERDETGWDRENEKANEWNEEGKGVYAVVECSCFCDQRSPPVMSCLGEREHESGFSVGHAGGESINRRQSKGLCQVRCKHPTKTGCGLLLVE